VGESSSRVRYKAAPEWEALADGIHARRMVEGNGTSIILYRLDSGRRFERHDHPFPELGVVLAGQGRVLIEDEARTLRAGDSFFIPGGTPHGFEVDAEGPVVLMNVTVPLLPDLPGPPATEVLHLAKEVVRHATSTPEKTVLFP
jgi:unsaturated pyranuronate lyase